MISSLPATGNSLSPNLIPFFNNSTDSVGPSNTSFWQGLGSALHIVSSESIRINPSCSRLIFFLDDNGINHRYDQSVLYLVLEIDAHAARDELRYELLRRQIVHVRVESLPARSGFFVTHT